MNEKIIRVAVAGAGGRMGGSDNPGLGERHCSGAMMKLRHAITPAEPVAAALRGEHTAYSNSRTSISPSAGRPGCVQYA